MTKTASRPLLTRIAFGLLWVFVFTVPLTQATEIPGVGMINKVAGLLAMAAGAAAVIARRQFRVMEGVHLTMAGFILWSAVTLCWSIAPELTVQRIVTYLQLFVLVLMIWELCEEEKDILRILSSFVLGTMTPALSTLWGFLPGQETIQQRASMAGFDPNNLAFMLALSLPASYYLILREKGVISALYRLQMGFAFCAILLTGSAAAMIAMAAGLSLVCWTFHIVPVRTRTNAFAVLMVLAGAAMVMVPASVWQHISQESQKSGATVVTAIQKGMEGIRSTPLGGYGAGSTTVTSGHARAVRQSSFTMLSEVGVVGVAWFVTLLGALFLSAEKMSGATKSFWFTALAVWMVSVCALSSDCSQAAWLMFGLLAAHSACLKQEGVTAVERAQKRNYYLEDGAEVWS